MRYCIVCGKKIPKKQIFCSVCYGNVDYGEDGYYRRYVNNINKFQEPLPQREEVVRAVESCKHKNA